MHDAMYVYACSRCGTEALVIGAPDPAAVVCDYCYPKRLTFEELIRARDEDRS
jgi:DNA-directed RNA polymerase subunit RPC12/RpoP